MWNLSPRNRSLRSLVALRAPFARTGREPSRLCLEEPLRVVHVTTFSQSLTPLAALAILAQVKIFYENLDPLGARLWLRPRDA